MIESFDELNLTPSLVLALKKENITAPMEIQRRVIPEAMKNNDLIVQSETGTGKTLAYLLPLFEKLNPGSRELQAIVLAPTHELAIQIQRQVERLSQNSDIKVNSIPVIGSVNIDRQIEKLKEKPQMVVGSAGRILELIKKRKIPAHTVKTIIIDEADRLMDENNIDDVKAVIKSTLKDRQLLMFSATISNETILRAKELMKEPEIVRGEGRLTVPASIEHWYFFAEQRDKIEVFRKLAGILNPQKAIVFVNKGDEIDLATAKLRYHGLKAEGIYGSNVKADRKKAMEEFRSGKVRFLVASDIAARGLDIEGVTHIFNLNMPEVPRDYLHRVGRTGRTGNAGTAVSIITGKELPMIRLCEEVLKIKMTAKQMVMGRIIDKKKAGSIK